MPTSEWFDFRTSDALNLHHVLYAEAWRAEQMETGATAQAQLITGDLAIRTTPDYGSAIAFYRSNLIRGDLLFDRPLRELSAHLVGRDGAVPEGWRAAFEPLLAHYVATDWNDHRTRNLRWTDDVTELLADLLPIVMPRLHMLFRQDFPDPPMLLSTVVVGRTGPAYTTIRPTHITCSTTHRKSQGRLAAEIVVHEACHAIAQPLLDALSARLPSDLPAGRDLWHVVLFHLCGQTVARALDECGIDYEPYIEATGLFERVWPELRTPVHEAWSGYLDGTREWDECCDQLAEAVTPHLEGS